MNYYNDNDKFVVKWLRELIKNGLIPDGHIDDRSIAEVKPDELSGYGQHHFFAGIAGWPRALELAGWDSTWPVWTASLPCQPFSCAGQQKGEKDERHLWQVFFNLVKECRPAVVFGEQVASKDGREWLAGVQTDLETMGYRCAAADLPAAGVASPHKRNRLFWVAIAMHSERWPVSEHGKNGCNRKDDNGGVQQEAVGASEGETAISTGPTNRLADSDRFHDDGARFVAGNDGRQQRQAEKVSSFWHNSIVIPCADGKWRRVPGRVVDATGTEQQGKQSAWEQSRDEFDYAFVNGMADTEHASTTRQRKHGRKPTHQPESKGSGTFNAKRKIEIEPALFPLADGFSNRVGTLRGAGNAIVPQVAAEFISAVMEIINNV